jgi:hypothetical protein
VDLQVAAGVEGMNRAEAKVEAEAEAAEADLRVAVPSQRKSNLIKSWTLF